MNDKQKKGTSKFLSFILRHSPETINLTLDQHGWADVEELLTKAATPHHSLTKEELEDIVLTNDKQRFIFNEDKTKIRANQGHSIGVELNLATQTPPDILYHGTVDKFVDAIKKEGLQKMDRQHVHLSKDTDTAKKVGSRRGQPVILQIISGEMHNKGYSFFLSDNGVWLTEHVPPEFIKF